VTLKSPSGPLRVTWPAQAMDAARRLGTAEPCFYDELDELGVARLLVGGHEDPDLKTFVAAVTQPLLDYDVGHDGALLATLRAFSRLSAPSGRLRSGCLSTTRPCVTGWSRYDRSPVLTCPSTPAGSGPTWPCRYFHPAQCELIPAGPTLAFVSHR
jgi:hypothetical protein